MTGLVRGMHAGIAGRVFSVGVERAKLPETRSVAAFSPSQRYLPLASAIRAATSAATASDRSSVAA